jgi:Zn-dependent protease
MVTRVAFGYSEFMDSASPNDPSASGPHPLPARDADWLAKSQPQVADDDSVRYEEADEDSSVTDISGRDEVEERSRPLQYAVRLPLILLALSCVSIFIAGCCRWVPHVVLVESVFGLDFTPLRRAIFSEWSTGIAFMLSLLAILLAHEFGHFFFTMAYRVRATLPLVIPFPISPLGTMGAVIAMEPGKANLRQIFDIGIAGPLAGLIVAIPILWLGIAELDLTAPASGLMAIRPPPLMDWWLQMTHPDTWTPGGVIWFGQANALLMAGWTGLFFTGLNMFPVGQLDGGHITYALLGRGAHWLARGLMVLAFAYMAYSQNTLLLLMALLVMLIGTDHPPTSDDTVPLGWPRIVLGWLSLIIPLVCLTPEFIIAV